MSRSSPRHDAAREIIARLVVMVAILLLEIKEARIYHHLTACEERSAIGPNRRADVDQSRNDEAVAKAAS